MPIKSNSDVLPVRARQVTINFNDLASGAAENALKLPEGSTVVGGGVHVVTAWNSATSDGLTIGTRGVGAPFNVAASAARYLNSAAGLRTANGFVPLVPAGYRLSNDEWLTVTWTGAGAAPTAGQAILTVLYVESGLCDGTVD